jgi:hypothetical protein
MPRLHFCFVGSRPAMTVLAWIAVLPFDPSLRAAGSAHYDRPTGFVTPSIAAQTRFQRNSATDRQRRNPHSV